MTYLSKRLKIGEWKKSFILSFLSATAIGGIYLELPNAPDTAGGMFAFSLTFFLPLLALAVILGTISTVYLIMFSRHLKEYDIRYRKQRIMATSIFLLPAIFHLIIAIYWLL